MSVVSMLFKLLALLSNSLLWWAILKKLSWLKAFNYEALTGHFERVGMILICHEIHFWNYWCIWSSSFCLGVRILGSTSCALQCFHSYNTRLSIKSACIQHVVNVLALKSMNQIAPTNIQDRFVSTTPWQLQLSLHSTAKNMMMTPYAKTSFGSRSFAAPGPKT